MHTVVSVHLLNSNTQATHRHSMKINEMIFKKENVYMAEYEENIEKY